MDGVTAQFLITAATALLLVAIPCGALVLFPVSRRLAKFLELLIEERRQGATLDQGEVQRLRQILAAHDRRIATLAEQQDFLLRMLADPEPGEPRPRGGRETRS